MSPRAQVAVLVIAAILAGGGVGALVVTLTKDDSTTGSTAAATGARSVTTTTAATGTSTVTATRAPVSNPPVHEAIGEVESKGYRVGDTGTYSPDQGLSVLVGVLRGSADGTAQKAFFFADGRFIGTDTADQSAHIQVSSQSDDEVALRYALYDRRDPQCCPTAGSAIVTYRWDGSSLKPLQAIPPSSYDVSDSRR